MFGRIQEWIAVKFLKWALDRDDNLWKGTPDDPDGW